MASRLILERTRVMIVEEDWDFGIKLADGFAARGYHPVLFRFIDAAIAELEDIRPRAIFGGLQCSEPTMRIDTSEARFLIQTISSRVPVITIADAVGEDFTTVVLRHGVRRFLFRTVHFSEVGNVLQSELHAAVA